MKAASERYQNAVKGITNLLTIIDQTRANKAQAQANLQLYTTQYNDALVRQRAAQEAIIAIEIKATQITSAIEGAQGRIGELEKKIAEIDAKLA